MPLNLANWIFPLARRLLYAFVRTRVFPQDIAELQLDPSRPVCYVLQHRRYTNLLVLASETRRLGLHPARAPLAVGSLRENRSFFFLTRPQPLAAKAKERYGHSPLLGRLVREVLAHPAADVQIVPVTILWGQAPAQQDSLLKALFAETWRPSGHFKQLLAILLHGRHTLVRFDAPLALRDLLAEDMGETQALRKLSRVLRVHFRRQREMAIGPDLSHRNTQVSALLAAPAVQAAITAAAESVAAGSVALRARRYALEIASDYSYGVVRAFELFLNWLWNRLYDGVEVRGFEAVASIAPGAGIVYVPCHRSHIDYLLLSFIILRRGLMPPHIAAGANLDIPLVGPLLRRGGAFFLRRSFKGDQLYAAVFDEYLHRMLTRGFPIEYFIEGGRSRSGRMLAPRTGLLGMTVRSYLRSHERPLYFVPVFIGYEKLIEGESFVGELAGKPKQGESLWGLLCSVRRLKDQFGKVRLSFGRPLALGAYLDADCPGWRESGPELDAAQLRRTTRDVAEELTRRINAAAVVNPINLAALALLATPKHTADEATLLRLIGHYQALLEVAAPGTAATSADAVVAYAERLGAITRIAHPLGDLLRADAAQAALLAYFRNNVLHLFALPALLACLLSHNPRLPKNRIEAAVAGLYGVLRPELFLRWSPPEIPATLDAILAVLQERGLLIDDGSMLAAPAPGSQEAAELQLLGETMRPTLERHFLTLALLQRHGSGRLTRRALEDACHLLAQRLALLYEFNAPEFSEKSLFAAVVGNIIDAGLIVENGDGLLHFDAQTVAPAEHAELLLAAEVRQAIRRIAGESGGETTPPARG
ncbi:MAG: glycerol-3-phosphate 1-O-acyltransferase PlsB [Rhodocyclales bacterium]|nr:glycerol-3-phosphate 1-O-acyltransferase PlsB [Rhodocyclales bacterium]